VLVAGGTVGSGLVDAKETGPRMSEHGDARFEPAMAIPFGSLLGTLVGVAVGAIFLDNVGLALVAGAGAGLMIGTVVYALLARSDES